MLVRFASDMGQRTTYCLSFWDRPRIREGTHLVIIPKMHDWIRASAGKACLTGGTDVPKNRLLALHPDFISQADQRVGELEVAAPSSDGSESAAHLRATSIFKDPSCSQKLPPGGGSGSCPQIMDFSSGFYAVLLAMELCDKVDVYGFDTGTAGSTPYKHIDGHFPEGRRQVSDHPHAFAYERRIMKYWDSQQQIRLHDGGSVLGQQRRGQ